MKSFQCIHIEDLKPVADYLLSLSNVQKVFRFDGEMGAGKTTLISVLCQKMGITETSSPTYSIVNNYYSETFGEVFHFDFYRLNDEQEALESGLDEILDSGNICFLEWAEKIAKLLPESYVCIRIEQAGELRNIDVSIV